jgi:hypothetical protein
MTRQQHRLQAEESLITCLPGLDAAAKKAVLAAVGRSHYPNLEAYSRAKAEVMRCRMESGAFKPSSFWWRWWRKGTEAVK